MRALVVVDVQQEYFDGPLQIQYPPRDQVLERILRAIAVARDHGLPVVFVQHTAESGSPVFALGSPSWQLHPRIAAVVEDGTVCRKKFASIYADTDLADWLHSHEVDTVTLVGFMTNNCDLASAVESQGLGITAEVLSDASGATHLANDAGHVAAADLQAMLMTLLHSNFAAVATLDRWTAAVADGHPLPKDNLVASALSGQAKFG